MPRKNLVVPQNYQPSRILPRRKRKSQNYKTVSFSYAATFEEEVDLWIDYYNSSFKKGQGFFFDFSNTPEYKEAILNGLIEKHGWILEIPTFIRNGKRIEDLDY